jgi:hypothetical protein
METYSYARKPVLKPNPLAQIFNRYGVCKTLNQIRLRFVP